MKNKTFLTAFGTFAFLFWRLVFHVNLTHLEKKRICEVSVNTFTFETKQKGKQIFDAFEGGEKEENILGNSPSIYIWGFTLFFEASELKGPICTSQLVALLLHLEVHILYLYFVLQSWWWSCNCILYLYVVLHSWWWSCNCIWYIVLRFWIIILIVYLHPIHRREEQGT